MHRLGQGLFLLAAVMSAAILPSQVKGQEPWHGPMPGPPLFGAAHPETEGRGDGAVSFLDSPHAISQVRIRYDAGWDMTKPTRGEYYWAKPGPLGPGVPLPETSLDAQDVDLYLEYAVGPRLSFFIQAPLRFLHPTINADETNFADLQAGIKGVFILQKDLALSGQVRAWVPTADARAGLGRDHFALEPGLLFECGAGRWCVVNADVRYYLPFDGTDFAGDHFRYGLGLTFGDRANPNWWITPVVEVVGWTFLSGQGQVVLDNGVPVVENVRDQTIVNAYLGVRFHLSESLDLYAGYGRAVSGETWFRDMARIEFRWAF